MQSVLIFIFQHTHTFDMTSPNQHQITSHEMGKFKNKHSRRRADIERLANKKPKTPQKPKPLPSSNVFNLIFTYNRCVIKITFFKRRSTINSHSQQKSFVGRRFFFLSKKNLMNEYFKYTIEQNKQTCWQTAQHAMTRKRKQKYS